MRAETGAGEDVVEGLDLFAFEGRHIIVERVTGEIESDGFEFFGEALSGEPVVDGNHAGLGEVVSGLAEERHLS